MKPTLTMSPGWIAVWVAWAVLFLGSFGIIEYISLKDRLDHRPPLTQVIQRFVPRWLFTTVLGGFSFWFYEHILG